MRAPLRGKSRNARKMKDNKMNLLRRIGYLGRVAFGACALLLAAPQTGAQAADLGGDCCADLEERVADLEATTVRKGNRKVTLTLSGQVNRALLFWDDGEESDVYSVDNSQTSLSQFRFEGEAAINPRLSTGYTLEYDISSADVSGVNQVQANGGQGLAVALSDASIWIANENLGQLTWGFTANASDGAPEMDLSGTDVVAYSAVADLAGGFFVRQAGVRGDAGLLGVTIGSFLDNLGGDSFDIVRYDSPNLAGFAVAASWGENDQWDVALTFEKELNSISVAAAIAYGEDQGETNFTVATSADDEVDQNTLTGSIALFHAPSGLNIAFAAGQRELDNRFRDNRGIVTTRADDQHYYYVKGGLRRRVNELGETAFYGEYGHYNDFLSNDADADTVNALDLDAAAVCAAAGQGCLVSGSEASIWGFGVVQYIDAAAMQLYAGFRHHEFEADLVDVTGAAIPSAALDDFQTVLVGARIEF